MIRFLPAPLVSVTLLVMALSLKSCPAEHHTLKRIKISPKQVLLLENAADVLGKRVASTKPELVRLETTGPFEGARAFLHSNVYESMREVRRTSSKFEMYSQSSSRRAASRIFFDDLLREYSGVEETLLSLEIGEYPAARKRAFDLFDHNVRAYMTVAESQSLTFDLVVTSLPANATIYYYRRGEDDHQYSDNTNTTVKNLTYAIWYVRVEHEDYESAEKPHDPFTEPNHILNFTLKPK